MLLKCPVIREGGSTYDVGGVEYHFKPQPDGEHVADVTDDAHLDRFLEIGFRPYEAGKKKAPVTPIKPAAPQFKGSDAHAPEYTIGETTHKIADVIAAAAARNELSVEAWNELTDEARAQLIDAELDHMVEASVGAGEDGDGEADGDNKGDDERAKAVDAYVEKFGKKPHHKWSAEKIREELAKQ